MCGCSRSCQTFTSSLTAAKSEVPSCWLSKASSEAYVLIPHCTSLFHPDAIYHFVCNFLVQGFDGNLASSTQLLCHSDLHTDSVSFHAPCPSYERRGKRRTRGPESILFQSNPCPLPCQVDDVTESTLLFVALHKQCHPAVSLHCVCANLH